MRNSRSWHRDSVSVHAQLSRLGPKEAGPVWGSDLRTRRRRCGGGGSRVASHQAGSPLPLHQHRPLDLTKFGPDAAKLGLASTEFRPGSTKPGGRAPPMWGLGFDQRLGPRSANLGPSSRTRSQRQIDSGPDPTNFTPASTKDGPGFGQLRTAFGQTAPNCLIWAQFRHSWSKPSQF